MTDCIVVGGGLIGMLSACLLHEAGAEVVVVDQGALGKEASWAGGGILSPLYPWRYPSEVTQLAQYGQQHYAAFAQALAEETGVDPQWLRSGLLMLGVSEPQRAQALAWAQANAAQIESIEAGAVRALAPALAESVGPGLWMAQIAQMRNPRLSRAMRERLVRRRIAFREHCQVQRILTDSGRVQGVETTQGVLRADKVLVAGGAWSAGLIEGLGARLDVFPVRGQMIVLQGPPGLLKSIVLHEDRYLIPRADGRIVVGSTLEYVGFCKQTTESACKTLRTEAVQMLPALEPLPIEHQWAGLRPGSRTGVPVISAHPQIDGLFVNTGHFRYGVVLGLASARLAAGLILGQNMNISSRFYKF